MKATWRTCFLALLLYNCGPNENADVVFSNEQAEHPFASDQATLLDFEFEGTFNTTSTWYARRQAESQIFYSVGQLNGVNSVGRLDRLQLTDLQATSLPDGTVQVTYRARLPVAWGSKTNLPESFEFVLPRRADRTGLSTFVDTYSQTCVSRDARDVTPGDMWYYYRPTRCVLDESDIVRIPTTRISFSTENTTGQFPEYDRVWEDEALRVVAIFGKYKDGATSPYDGGIAAYNRFVRTMKRELGPQALTVPAELPDAPGVDLPDVAFEHVDVSTGRRVSVHALLVDNVRSAGPEFDARYAELTPEADLIVYNGHAGLGANIRALARKGSFRAGQYQIFFMNGCDTFAYIDDALARRKAELNPDDPNGTRDLDVVTNALPSYFHSMSSATMTLFRALRRVDAPETYEGMFGRIDPAEVVVVTGEEDNQFVPAAQWPLDVQNTVRSRQEAHYRTDVLPAGTYTFTLEGVPGSANGDADLYVRVGATPTLRDYDCRPYANGSMEACTVTLESPSLVGVMVRGYSARSSYTLVAE